MNRRNEELFNFCSLTGWNILQTRLPYLEGILKMFDINHLIINTFNPIGPGVLAHIGYFQPIGAFFLTHGTSVADQYIINGIHK